MRRKIAIVGREITPPKVQPMKEVTLSELEMSCLREWDKAGNAFRGGMVAAIKKDEVVMVFTKEQFAVLNKTFSLDL